MAKSKKQTELEEHIEELKLDLQRTRADFENYRKRVEQEKNAAREHGQSSAVLKLLPVVDTIERATANIPKDISGHKWVQGVGGIVKQLDKVLADFGLSRIDAKNGTKFNPELHQAVQFDEESEGDTEVVAEELQAGYTINKRPIRHSMVKVTRK